MQKTDSTTRVRRLVLLGILCALEIVLTLPPLGFLKIGPVVLAVLPVLIVSVGAMVSGPLGGAVMGTLFGISSFITAFSDPIGMLTLSINPWLTAVNCILPRLAMGWLVGVLFAVITKSTKDKQPSVKRLWAGSIAAAVAAPLLNTFFYLGAFYFFFANNPLVQEPFGVTSAWGIILPILSFNALIELAVCAPLAVALSRAVRPLIQKTRLQNT